MEKQFRLFPITNNNHINYDKIKSFNGQTYSGMSVGASHHWNYQVGNWDEIKISPNEWRFSFQTDKKRTHNAPDNTGAEIGAEYHWYILADQKVKKIDANTYSTYMEGLKYKVGYRRPAWHRWSYEYPDQISYKHVVIAILERYLAEIKNSM